jgi:hypothetical protein
MTIVIIGLIIKSVADMVINKNKEVAIEIAGLIAL